MAEYVTQAEYARMRGISRTMVSKHKAAGRVVFSPDGKIDVDATDAVISTTCDPARGGDRTGKRRGLIDDAIRAAGGDPARAGIDGVSLEEARRMELLARARKAELEAGVIEGRLVERATVERAAADQAIRLREALISLPDRLASQLAAETDAAKIHRMIGDEVLRAVDDFARALRL